MSISLPPHVTGLRCVLSGWHTTDPWTWYAPSVGPASRMDVEYAPDAPARMAAALPGRPFDMWRYGELLPVPTGASLPPVSVGG